MPLVASNQNLQKVISSYSDIWSTQTNLFAPCSVTSKSTSFPIQCKCYTASMKVMTVWAWTTRILWPSLDLFRQLLAITKTWNLHTYGVYCSSWYQLMRKYIVQLPEAIRNSNAFNRSPWCLSQVSPLYVNFASIWPNLAVHCSQSSGVKVTQDCLDAFERCKMKKEHPWIIFRLTPDYKEIIVDVCGDKSEYTIYVLILLTSH